MQTDVEQLEYCCLFFFSKQKTAYERRISDWSSDVCPSDLAIRAEPIGYRIDIDAVEIMEQEQRARQRGQPPDRGDPATIIQPAHDITCAATAARQSRKARDI